MAEQNTSDPLDDPDENNPDREPGHKDFWDKLRASGTIVVAVVVAAMGGWFNHQQAERNRVSAESQFYTDLLAQREQSDSQLRTEMFKTLFEAYFRGRLATGGSGATASAPPAPEAEMVVSAGPASKPVSDFASLEQRIMFLDVLVRNFENIDIRPLFEDLDQRLTEIVWSADRDGVGVTEARQRAFRLRWQLRRAALGNVVRQVSALSGLDGARVERMLITEGTCEALRRGGDGAADWIQDIDEPRVFAFGTMLINRLEDGSVSLSLVLNDGEGEAGGSTQPQKMDFQVTFFDMPVLENIRLPTGERLAVTLESYFSPAEYEPFVAGIPDQATQLDYKSFLEDRDLKTCRKAQLTLLQFPDSYIGPRDRPYIQNLIKTKL